MASAVTTLTTGLTYLAVILRPLLSFAGYDARTTRPGSVMHDVVQLDIVSSAMCGQPGDVNARAAAALLNDPEVRARLVARGISA